MVSSHLGFFDESMTGKTKVETDIQAKTGLTNKSIQRLLEAPKIQRQYKTKMKLLNPYVVPTAEIINLLLGTSDGNYLLDTPFSDTSNRMAEPVGARLDFTCTKYLSAGTSLFGVRVIARILLAAPAMSIEPLVR